MAKPTSTTRLLVLCPLFSATYDGVYAALCGDDAIARLVSAVYVRGVTKCAALKAEWTCRLRPGWLR